MWKSSLLLESWHWRRWWISMGTVAPLGASEVVASCSYDKTVRLWDAGGSRQHQLSSLAGHAAPVVQMAVGRGGMVATGDRGGSVIVWEVSQGGPAWRLKNIHKGHITAIAILHDVPGHGAPPLILTGGQDGTVRAWDPRQKNHVAKNTLHSNDKGRGAVGAIIGGSGAFGGLVITCGADKTLKLLDPRSGFCDTAAIALSDFPYSLSAVGNLALCGCGDGSLVVVDVERGEVLYGLGANRAAVRTLECSADTLLCSGDDGRAIVYRFGA
ncbi:unnamed protein product [Ostreobium quekettii]|uniref:Uncharacterized protein n=1 Tax=Ostreobium quekettii TaxID=121088 RepID=A0A8S1JGM5_9CHLO|nr:unnamed protein product [Ostreobium quekettii]